MMRDPQKQNAIKLCDIIVRSLIIFFVIFLVLSAIWAVMHGATAEIKDRPDDDKDNRPHAKIKDPKEYDLKYDDQPSVSGTKFLSGTNASDINWGKVITQNATLTQPVVMNDTITRILELQVNFTNNKFDLDTLQNLGYHLNMHIKSDRYAQWMQYPIGEQLAKNNKIYIPIVNNTEDTDDGGDFRIDFSINQFKNKYEKATYASLKNQSSDSVNIDDILAYVIEDEKEEGNYVDNAGIDKEQEQEQDDDDDDNDEDNEDDAKLA
jgi:hypothetical protein